MPARKNAKKANYSCHTEILLGGVVVVRMHNVIDDTLQTVGSHTPGSFSDSC